MTSEEPSRTPSKTRVLLVDDDQFIRRILAVGLKVEGYEVLQAVNGREALAVLREQGADVVVVDLMMPVMDGRAFLQRAREEMGPALPVLMLTSVDRADATRDLLEGGASGILHKPAKVPEIVEQLRKLVP